VHLDDRLALLVPNDVPRPLVDFRAYKEDIEPRHFILRADDTVYVGSYLSHEPGSDSYLMKLRDFGDGLYKLFEREIEHITEHTTAWDPRSGRVSSAA